MKNKLNTKQTDDSEKYFEADHFFGCEDVGYAQMINWKFQVRFFNNIQCKFEVDANWTLTQISAITRGLRHQKYKADEDQSEVFEMKYHFINTQTSQCDFVLIITKPNLMTPQIFHSFCKRELGLGVEFNTLGF